MCQKRAPSLKPIDDNDNTCYLPLELFKHCCLTVESIPLLHNLGHAFFNFVLILVLLLNCLYLLESHKPATTQSYESLSRYITKGFHVIILPDSWGTTLVYVKLPFVLFLFFLWGKKKNRQCFARPTYV